MLKTLFCPNIHTLTCIELIKRKRTLAEEHQTDLNIEEEWEAYKSAQRRKSENGIRINIEYSPTCLISSNCVDIYVAHIKRELTFLPTSCLHTFKVCSHEDEWEFGRRPKLNWVFYFYLFPLNFLSLFTYENRIKISTKTSTITFQKTLLVLIFQ